MSKAVAHPPPVTDPGEDEEMDIEKILRWRRRLGGGLAVLAIAGAGVGLDALFVHHHRPVPATHPATKPLGPAGVAPGGKIVVPAPKRYVDGVGLGYPDTTAGAVSAAAHFSMALVNAAANPSRAAQVDVVIDAPGFPSQPQADQRQIASALAKNPSLAQWTASLAVEDYAVGSCSPTRCNVWLLAKQISTNSQTGKTTAGPQAVGATVVWTNGDWRENPVVTPPNQPPMAPPGSPAALAKGWAPLAVGN